MNIIFKHIFYRIFVKHVTLTMMIVGLIWLAQSLRYMDLIINNRLSLDQFFTLVLYLLPDLFVLITPISFAITLLFWFQRMIATHELSGLRALGMSNYQITAPALTLASIISVSLILLNMVIVPSAFQKFREKQHIIQCAFSGVLLREGRFNTANNLTVFVREQNDSDELKGIFIYHKPKSDVQQTYSILADSGHVYTSGEQFFILLKQGQRQEYNPKTHAMTLTSFDELIYDLSSELAQKKSLNEKPAEKSLKQLLFPDTRVYGEVKRKFQVEAHQRILLPLLCFVDVFLIAVFLLSSEMGRVQKRRKLVIASISVFLSHMLVIGLIQSSMKIEYSFYYAYLFVIIVCLGFGGKLIKDSRSNIYT